jgi:hypothetical protein
VFVFAVYVATVAGLVSGATADSVSNATAERGEDYNISFDDREHTNPIAQEANLDEKVAEIPSPIPEKYRMAWRSAFRSVLTTLIIWLMEWSNIVSVWAFENGWWIKEWWLRPVIQASSYALLLGVGYYWVVEPWRMIRHNSERD